MYYTYAHVYCMIMYCTIYVYEFVVCVGRCGNSSERMCR